MPVFKYEATTQDGKPAVGEIEADDRDQVATLLHGKGMVVITIDEKLDLGLSKLFNISIGGLPLKEKVVFSKQLSTMLVSGLPLIQALNIMIQQSENQAMKKALTDVYQMVEAGSSLSEAFRKEGTIYEEVQLSLIEAGEKSGTLNEIMIRIAIELEKAKKLRGKIIGAMIYPIIIFIVMIGVFIMLVVFMVPGVKDLYADFGADELPAVTQFMIDLSDVMTNPLGMAVFVAIIVSAVLGYRYYYATDAGRRQIDKLFLKVPVFGNLNTKIQLTQFSRLLGLLLQSGVPIVESLQIVSRSLTNSNFSDVVTYSSDEVLKGSSLSLALSKGEVFPIIMLKMVATGEETGKLDSIMGDMALFYEDEVNEITSNLTKLMEPFILLIVGVMVGFIAVAIYLPLYSLGNQIQ